jgi:hypothetical protein
MESRTEAVDEAKQRREMREEENKAEKSPNDPCTRL